MKVNIDKCRFLSSLDSASTMTIEKFTIQNSVSQKLLGITIDRLLNFNEHVSNLCKTTNLKITALARVLYDSKPKENFNERLLYITICLLPTVMDESSRSLDNRINTLHERALRLTYNDFTSSFTKLLKKDNLATIHKKIGEFSNWNI